MKLSWDEIQANAVAFSKRWKDARNEEAEAQSFLMDFLRVFGVDDLALTGDFEFKVPLSAGKTGYIDYLWKAQIAIEMKSRGKDLTAAFDQLQNYMRHLPDEEIPDLWMVCDFESVRVCRRSSNEIFNFKTKDLRKHIKRFANIADYTADLKKEPQAEKWFRPWLGADEFINGYCRYCLWLGDCPPDELRRMPEAMKRVDAVKQYRLNSKSAPTRKIADTPRLFHVKNMPSSNYIVIPEVSSERRKYIPIGFLTPDTLCSNLVKIIPNATLYHFGILTSNVHMAWTRVVCGRLEMRYRYAKDIVYNNFPWPDVTDEQKTEIEKPAQAVLDARALFPDSSLADLYDPISMPSELLKAHHALDRAVMKLYGFAKDAAEPAIVAALMQRHKKLTAK